MSALAWLAWLTPLAIAALLPALRPDRLAARVAALAPLPALALALWGAPEVAVELRWVLFGARFGLDATGRPFLLMTAVLWLLGGAYAAASLRDDPARRRFTGFFLVTQAGGIGVVLAQDIAGFYLGYAVMTFAAYGLVVHAGHPAARRAGRVYIAMAVAGEAALLVAFLLLAGASGSTRIATAVAAVAGEPVGGPIAALLVVGFGVKTGLPLLHLWLPLAHPVAPTPASAMLSAVIVKSGLLGWLRFLPLGQSSFEWASLLTAAGVAAMFGAAAVGVLQRDAKVVLAYSTVSQMGFAAVAVGAGLAVPAAWPALLAAVVVFALNHGVAKAALFFGIGVARAGVLPPGVVRAGLLLPALALAGAPLSAGARVKQLLGDALAAVDAAWAAPVAALLPAAAVATTLLMARVLVLARHEHGSGAPLPGLVAPWLAALAAVVGIALRMPAGSAAAPAWQGLGTLVDAWPVALGAVLALGAARAVRGRRSWVGAIPPGDLLMPIQRLLEPLARAVLQAGRRLDSGLAPPRADRLLAAAGRADRMLRAVSVAGGLLLATGALLALALAWG